MINPNRVHRARATIIELPKSLYGTFKVKLAWNGAIVEGYDLPKGFKVGDVVNIQGQYSIMSQAYMVETVRKIRKPKPLLALVK